MQYFHQCFEVIRTNFLTHKTFLGFGDPREKAGNATEMFAFGGHCFDAIKKLYIFH